MKKFKPINTVIFDLGNVLFAWNPKKIADLVKQEIPDSPDNLFEIPASRAWHLCDEGCFNYTTVVDLLSGRFEPLHIEKFVSIAKNFFRPIRERLAWVNLFKTLKCRLYFLSNLSEEFYLSVAQEPVFKFFDGGLCSFQAHCSKPTLEFYLQLLRKYPNIKPRETIFIDDIPQNVTAANMLGINGILCKSYDDVYKEILRKNFSFKAA